VNVLRAVSLHTQPTLKPDEGNKGSAARNRMAVPRPDFSIC
jgi:hypothetical protein